MVGTDKKYVKNNWLIDIVDVGKEPNYQRLSTFTIQIFATILIRWNFNGIVFFCISDWDVVLSIIWNFLRAMFLDYCQKIAPFMKRMEFFFNIQWMIYGVEWKGDESFQENDVTLLGNVVPTIMHFIHFLVDWTNSIIVTL